MDNSFEIGTLVKHIGYHGRRDKDYIGVIVKSHSSTRRSERYVVWHQIAPTIELTSKLTHTKNMPIAVLLKIDESTIDPSVKQRLRQVAKPKSKEDQIIEKIQYLDDKWKNRRNTKHG